MKQKFLGKSFEFGGNLQNLDKNEGNFHGIYIIVRPDNFGKINLNNFSALETWKGKIVAMPVFELQQKLSKLGDSNILYIGKSQRNVRKRVIRHADFWGGKSVSAYGGRIIGQIQGWERLEVWYLECDNPSQTEHELLKYYKAQYGDLPFANLKE